MTALDASVVVVTRHRAEALLRCLLALTLQDHPAFELIVVADPASARLAQGWLAAKGLAGKVIAFDEANISQARNLGIARAAGQVVAFIDDDAVAEPTWLSRLVAPFAAMDVIAATGFVRGRNGISWQWQACEVDCAAQDHPVAVAQTSLFHGTPKRAIKTLGTNCGFRLNSLRAAGGFDPAYRFYLEDADIALRLAPLGAIAVVPAAEVQHGFAASERRSADRVPLTLFDIAASTAVFLRRHAPDEDFAAAWARLQAREADRIDRHLRARRIDAAGAARLMQGLAEGWQAGLTRDLITMQALTAADREGFLGFGPTAKRPGITLSGRFWQRRRLMQRASELARAGSVVSVICLSPTARPHRITFMADGYWMQRGGLFGPSERSQPRFRLIGFGQRVLEETHRLAAVRPVSGAAGP